MKESICVFPDTNIFLHYPPLSQIDWASICDAKSVQIVISMTVIHELDTKKTDSRLGNRAERAIKEIRDTTKSGAEIRSGVTVRIFNREVRDCDFPDTLNPEMADDRIVHEVRLFKGENSDDEVVIATGDFGMELRATAGGISTVELDSSLRLANPQDELTKKYKQAITELHAIKNRQPELVLGLSLPGDPMSRPHEVIFRLSNSWDPLDVDQEVERVKLEHPKSSSTQATAMRLGPAIFGALGSPEKWKKYDEKLDDFYEQSRQHFENVNTLREVKHRTFEFDLWLANEGNGLAEDIDLLIRLPNVIRHLAEKNTREAAPFEQEPSLPKPPQRPQILELPSLRQPFDYLSAIPERRTFPADAPIWLDAWTPALTVRYTESEITEVSSKVGKLKHGHTVCLGSFYATFRHESNVAPFWPNMSLRPQIFQTNLLVQSSSKLGVEKLSK